MMKTVSQRFLRKIAVLFLLMPTFVTLSAGAQTVNGDMNHNGRIDVADITILTGDYLSGHQEHIGGESSLAGKRVAFLDGSQCVHAFEDPGTGQYTWQPLRERLVNRLGVRNEDIEVVAMEGAGVARPEFSSPAAMNLCRQALTMVQREACEVYVIWLQTNDYTGSGNMLYPTEIGKVTDEPGSADVSNDNVSFCGGLNYTINTLRNKNPLARILLISPTRTCYDFTLGATDRGYVTEQTLDGENTLYRYVVAMKEYADYHSLPFLDLFTNGGISLGNKRGKEAMFIWQQTHYDSTRLNPNGYARLADKIVHFIANE